MKKIKIPFILLIFGISIAQDDAPQTPRFSDYQISSERYLTDDNGNIMMYVNVCLGAGWKCRASYGL